MEKKIAIVGGDLRIAMLAELLAKDEWQVDCLGFEKYAFELENIRKVGTIEELLKDKNYVFSSIPLSKDGVWIKAPFSEEKILIEELLQKMKQQTLIAGVLPTHWMEKYKETIQFVDLLQDECLTVQNAISTVEGAIQKIMESTTRTIYQSKILILGFGRIGKLLANRLQSFGAQIFCEARKQTDLTWIEAYGFLPIDLCDFKNIDLSIFDIIINTIPKRILGEEEIRKLNPKCFVIDLASLPGGFDLELIKKYHISFQWALGLPGEVTPTTSAEFLKQAFERVYAK